MGIVIYTVFIVIFVIMAIVVPETLSNYTQDYGYGTHHKVRDIDRKTGIFWHILSKNLDRALCARKVVCKQLGP
jgi:hypothetical protein